MSSRPRYTTRKWLAEHITEMPSVAKRVSVKNSPLSMSRLAR